MPAANANITPAADTALGVTPAATRIAVSCLDISGSRLRIGRRSTASCWLEVVGIADVTNERIEITNQRRDVAGPAALPRRLTVAAQIPGKGGVFRCRDSFDQLVQPPGMLMPAMHQNNRPIDRLGRDPGPVKKLLTIKGPGVPLNTCGFR